MKTNFFQNEAVVHTLFFGSLILLMVILPFDEGGNGYILQLLSQVILLLWTTLWAIQVLRRGQLGLMFDWIDLFVLGFVVWAVVSLYFSEYKYTTLLELIKVLSAAALFYLCRTLFPLNEKRTALLVAMLGSSLIQLLVALYSFFIRHTPILQAGFVNPNELACFFVIGINIALSVLLFYRPEQDLATEPRRHGEDQNLFLRSTKIYFCTASVSAGCLVMALLALRSRGAMIGFVCTGIFLTTLKKKRLGLAFLVSVGLLLVLPLPHGSIAQRLRKQDDPFAYQRIEIWKSTLKMISDHPVLGVGLGMYQSYGTTYNFPVEHLIARYGKRLDLAHSDLLQIGAEMGLISMLLFVGGLVRMGYYSLLQLKNYPVSWHVAAASAGIFGVFIQGLFSNLLFSPAIAMTTVLLGVILVDEVGKYRPQTYTFSTSFRSTWPWYLALGLVLLYLLVPVIGYPFFGHYYYLKYQQLRKAQALPQAVQQLQTALKFVPIQAYYHEALGNLYLAAFRNQPNLDAFYEGYKEFTQAIRYHPRESKFYFSLAELHREMFRRKLPTKPTAHNALREYQQAIQTNPFDPFMRFALATLHADLGEFDQALAVLQEAVKIEPNFVGGYQMLGKLLTHLQRTQEAAEAFQQADNILRQYKVKDDDSEYVKSLLRSIK